MSWKRDAYPMDLQSQIWTTWPSQNVLFDAQAPETDDGTI